MPQNERPDANQRTGRHMLLFAWVGGIVLLTVLFQDVLQSRFNPNSAPQGQQAADGRHEVVLDRNASGHYVASGRINGLPVVFLLDTGATDVALPEALADRLRLVRTGGGISQTANGAVAVWQTVLDEVQLGDIRLQDVRASIVPSMAADAPVLLGMSFLRQLEFSQRDGQLTLRH
ncbi:MAG: TIGR02281 family clan AA aspartic protease [Gammaproteobacteria bacterium]|nr:TIGR02281 family clan AA aspartic protease [Gammaproteobacteria bacterium]